MPLGKSPGPLPTAELVKCTGPEDHFGSSSRKEASGLLSSVSGGGAIKKSVASPLSHSQPPCSITRPSYKSFELKTF